MYDGAQIDYDEMGNPIVYKGNTFVWEQGRKLTSGTMNGKSFTYTYDGNGMRYKKVVGGKTTNFYYNGTQLLIEDRVNGIGRIYYIYGASGIAGMVLQEGYSPKTYYFDKNTLGDIIAIRDENGNVVASYKYDAWGNHTVHNEYGGIDYSATSIGNINPFRYRGYYYDTETGFYYLQTRYYDPTICRFINADNYELVSELASSMQLNMYAYCGNNPVMGYDPTGFFWEWVSGIGRILVGISAVITGSLVFASGVALTPMLIIAGVTIAAGVLTGINGIADIQQAVTGNNFVRDSLFSNNQNHYNLYAGIIEGVASIGGMICGGWLTANQPRIQAYRNIVHYSPTKTVAGHVERAYNNSILLQKQIIKYGKMTRDLQTATGYVFTAAGSFNGANGILRLVISNSAKMIWHFGFGF